MKYILSAEQMRSCDRATIESHDIPSLVLMERAALSVVITILSKFPSASKILIICGPGNNGADGVAIARMLHLRGKNIRCVVLGDASKYTDEIKAQISILESYGISTYNQVSIEDMNGCDLVIDAMFGIGLKRGLEGDYMSAATIINKSGKPVVAVDIPSGYDATSGRLLGDVGARVDITVTFAYMKKGLVLGECKAAAGDVQIADVGIYADSSEKFSHLLDDSVLSPLPKRQVTANKGSLGKVLVIAGSENIYGACYLSAYATLTTGSGLVKIYTHKNNIDSIQKMLPEAMYQPYDAFDENIFSKMLDWADVILIGPGLGTSEVSERIFDYTISNTKKPMVIDADGLNILSSRLDEFRDRDNSQVVITPHLKEMERLTGTLVSEINYDMERVAWDFASEYGCTVALKNHTTVIATRDNTYYCISGNEALATPGSGDVLAGIIASLIGQGLSVDKAAYIGAYLHGKAGTNAATDSSVKGVLARDIIESVKKLV